ncbi:regulator of chromosome condensation 1/beta-lactamase-inhibitor protein II [Lipomyces tetrasporus]|uniref:Regulator of chromosome condensation 1/beta-lactamase-inhibitor protein II n=1 Tax=Lipomyces tetrasporus TaxID=54092 RepID=A0AAD7QR20_9ASCO|nr:regulator of chromosome condensation 1/beta-lactamase-inhibitor protein II [Lipomyces tetrasporus]KAJ8099883.1 regulator of chromosome condensation 1/beta-lactamase-inhibitor protein II [Lipomyces tetrasporus]
MPKKWLYAVGLDIYFQLRGEFNHIHGQFNSGNCTGESVEPDDRKKRKLTPLCESENDNGNQMDACGILGRPLCIAQGQIDVEVLWVGWTETLVRIDQRVELRGFSVYKTDSARILQLPNGVRVVSGFGWAELLGIVDSCGQIWRFKSDTTMTTILYLDKELSAAFDNAVLHVAITGSEHVAVLHDCGTSISTFWSLLEFYAHSETKKEESSGGSRKQFGYHQHLQFTCIRSGELHFVALDSDGQVYTWGDNLHGELLQPGGSLLHPQSVPALEGIPMRDIATNGFMTACLSRDTKDVYIWGWTPDTRIIGLPNTVDVAGIVDQFAEDEDTIIESVAVGNGFVVLASSNSITYELCVWIAGGSDLTDTFGLSRSESFVKVNGDWSGKRSDRYGITVSCGMASMFIRLYQK